MIFSHGELNSVEVIKRSLDEFKECSGLSPSLPKSTAFSSNVQNPVKTDTLKMIGFVEGALPIKYLGVPLIPSRLCQNDCKILVEKVKNRLGDWKNKTHSFAGRLQLILSVSILYASLLVFSFYTSDGNYKCDTKVDKGFSMVLR